MKTEFEGKLLMVNDSDDNSTLYMVCVPGWDRELIPPTTLTTPYHHISTPFIAPTVNTTTVVSMTSVIPPTSKTVSMWNNSTVMIVFVVLLALCFLTSLIYLVCHACVWPRHVHFNHQVEELTDLDYHLGDEIYGNRSNDVSLKDINTNSV